MSGSAVERDFLSPKKQKTRTGVPNLTQNTDEGDKRELKALRCLRLYPNQGEFFTKTPSSVSPSVCYTKH